jgi:hypothetical protein
LILVNPADLHDGRAVGDGYSYRMVYAAPEVFEKAAHEDSGSKHAAAPLFRSSMIRDEQLAAMVRGFNRPAERHEGLDQLALESGLLQLLRRLLDRHGSRADDARLRRNNGVIRTACWYLEEKFAFTSTIEFPGFFIPLRRRSH